MTDTLTCLPGRQKLASAQMSDARSDEELELAFYEEFLIEAGIEPYPVQEEAFSHIFAGHNVLVTVPTGTGKTLMAKAGIFRALHSGKTAVYTTPLRALTEEKFRELCEDFGEENVGFATGDYKVNPAAPIQVLVAEILWNRIYGDRVKIPADIVIMDEGHYFNEPERGYVWEQSVIGLDPRSQLVILSATIGQPQAFCQWAYMTRRVQMHLVQSYERKIPLEHQWREQYLVELVKELYGAGDYPAIIFCFSRNECFERARLLKSCPRFTSDEERESIREIAADVLMDTGLGPDLIPLLSHGIGVHHAGILPKYKQLVEGLTLERKLKFVVSTETIAAGINLPAKRVVFPSIRKYIKGKARLLRPDEYHQMSGRAGRPQFDTEGIAITLAPEEVVQEFRKEIKERKKKGFAVDEEKVKRGAYLRAKTEANKRRDVSWDAEAHAKIIAGEPAALSSRTKITAEQILAIGLPDLAVEKLPGQALLEIDEDAPPAVEAPAPDDRGADAPYLNLNIRTVIDNLLLDDRNKREAQKRLAMVTANLQALNILDEHGEQIAGEIIGQFRGIDGMFVWYLLMNSQPSYDEARELVEFLVDHDSIHRALTRKDMEKRRDWIRAKLREMRQESSLVEWEDAEAEYDKEFPPVLSTTETIHQAFKAAVPHPELHGGKTQKNIWATMEDEEQSFTDFVTAHGLEREEGSLFSYLARVMKTARMIYEVTSVEDFDQIDDRVCRTLGEIDRRVLAGRKGDDSQR